MKKFFCLFLCTVLLASCSKNKADVGRDALGTPENETTPQESEFQARLNALEAFEPRTEIINRRYEEYNYEFKSTDYGRLYPFPAFVVRYGDTYGSALYGFMTESGEIVLDGVYDSVTYFDIDDGYYYMERMIPHETEDDRWRRERTVMTLDGSKRVSVPHHITIIGNERIRVFEFRYEGYERGEFVGVLDMDENIVSPFVSSDEFAWFNLGTGMRDHGIYINRETLEAFTDIQGVEFNPVSISLGENDELEAVIKHSTDMISLSHILGITVQISDDIFLINRPYRERDWGVESFAVDKDGNVLREFPEGYGFIGNLIRTWNPNGLYDFELNEIDFSQYGAPNQHLEGDTYLYWYWDEAEQERTYYAVNVVTGEAEIFEGDPWQSSHEWRMPTDSGFTIAFENDYIGVKNADGDWLIKIDTLKFKD
ncbi:MAG: hypothetical protein FWD48_07580 [Oscillospiraceae bacterium]|nr:hypothetical protein [Oscillospiraceae bacterium]